MCRRGSEKANNSKDKELIMQNAKSISVLLEINKNNEFTKELKEVEEKLKFLRSSSDSKVYSYDKKIADAIGDLKIALTKAKDDGDNKKADERLKELLILIAERNVNA